MCVGPCGTCNSNNDFKLRIQIKINLSQCVNQGYEEQISLSLLNLFIDKYMPKAAYYSCSFELFHCFLMDSLTYMITLSAKHFNRAYIGQQLQVPSSLEWATNGKQLQRARKLQVIIWFLTLIYDSIVRKYNIGVRKIESNRPLSIWGEVVWLMLIFCSADGLVTRYVTILCSVSIILNYVVITK